ncbi:MAG: isoprenyl transferase [Bacteroidales bacterium]|nr:isoprenyl transferase [Bacteroidales bacterium]
MKTLQDIDPDRVPRHVAVIMDGNGRWAKQKAQRRLYGHQHAIEAVRQTVEAAAEMNVQHLTLYSFSTENWNRPKEEVEGLMNLFVKAVQEETPLLMKNNVRLQAIGDIGRMPKKSLDNLHKCIDDTSHNTGLTLILALSYSSRWEMAEALKAIVRDGKNGLLKEEEVNEETLRHYLGTKDIPDPDLLIRTGGELRVSNFLLWQMAYTEFYFTDLLWPDFRKPHFYEAVCEYQGRQRRFGKTGDQVEKNKA